MSSAVELPRVPSARRGVHSASSTTSSQASCRSKSDHYSRERGTNHEENGDEEEEENGDSDDCGGDEDGGDNEEEGYDDDEGQGKDGEPQEQTHGSGLWEEVEQFLNKPPPRFSSLGKGDSHTNTSSKTVTRTNVLPTLAKERPGGGGGGNQAAHASRSGVGGAAPSGSKTIDPNLLQQAFAYAERVQAMGFADDAADDQQGEANAQRRGPGQANCAGSSAAARNLSRESRLTKQDNASSSRARGRLEGAAPDKKDKKKKNPAGPGMKSASAYGAPVKPTAPTKKRSDREHNSSAPRGREREAAGSGWNSSPSSVDPGSDGRKGGGGGGGSSCMDPQTLQSLLSNFQNGTTLEELRRELAASQQSMAMSQHVIQNAASSFFQQK